MRFSEVKQRQKGGKIEDQFEVVLRLQGVGEFDLRTKLEPTFGNHRLQTLVFVMSQLCYCGWPLHDGSFHISICGLCT